MEKTPKGTSVGVDDPYAFAGICDHLTAEGRCRYAVEHAERDRKFATERAREEFACPVGDTESEWDWADCPHFRSRNQDRTCARCGLVEKRIAHTADRPLLEEHHLSYDDTRGSPSAQTPSHADDPSDDEGISHEITIYLCRWCHAKVHRSWARITDDVSPVPEAIAELENRRGRELDELGFESAADRYGSADE